MGVLAPVSAPAGPSAQPPIGTSGNFPARVSAKSPSNISHNPSEVISEVSEVYKNSKIFVDFFQMTCLDQAMGMKIHHLLHHNYTY